MAPSITKEVLQAVAVLGPSVDDDFYVATFREGKFQKVINMTGGLPRRVRRVLDFDSKVEIEKEEALALKRQELQLESRLEYEILTGKKERTLAEVLLEMKKRKKAGALATVQRKKLIPAKKISSVKKAVSVKNVSPVKDVFFFDEVVSKEEAAPMDEENHMDIVVSLGETIPVEKVVPVEASPPRKKRKRRSTSLLHTSSKLLDPLNDRQGDDETLAEFLKKSVSTTGRASSDNVGIKVFQRRKVKFKAVRRRTSMVGDKQSSSILVCDDLCECEVCGRLSLVAPNSVECPTTGSTVSTTVSVLTSCSTNTVSNDVLEDDSLEGLLTNEADQLLRPDSCMGDFDSLTLPDDIHHLPALHCNPPTDDTDDIQEPNEQFRVQVAQKAPASCEVASLGSVSLVSNCPNNSHVGKCEEYLESPSDDPECCDYDIPKLLDVKSRPQLHEETSCIEGDVGRGPCAFNTESSNFSIANPSDINGNTHPVAVNAASVVTPMELDLAVERIESILETLVTPDDLLPTHLSASISSASISTRKKKRRRSFGESLSSDVVIKEGTSLREVSGVSLRVPQDQEGDLAESTSLDSPSPVTEIVLNSVSNVTKTVAFFATSESSVILGEHISGQISEGILEQISELISKELDPTPISTLSSLSEAKEPSAACTTDVEVVLPSSHGITVVNAEESSLNGSDSLMPLSDAVEVIGTPTKSSSCDDGSDICLTPSIGLDAAERDEGVGCASTSKTLFSNSKTNGFSKRNRKSFSPKSQKAFLKACREERSIPTFKIKLMKSNLSDQSFSMLLSEKTIQRKPSQLQDPTPDEFSSHDMLQCDVEQVQLLASSDSLPLSPLLQTSDDTPNMSAPSLSGLSSDCHIDVLPGSPEYKSVTDPVSICTPDNTVNNLPCTEGSLHINVECHSETPIDPKTPNEPVSQQPKSILKTRSDTCRGICDCPKCVSTCELSTTARNFIRSQMRLADLVAGKLLDEMRNMRTLLEDASPSLAEREAATSASNIPSEKAKVALESATKTDDWAKKEILKMSRDSKRVCRLIEVGPRRTIFADDAGHRLCHIRHLPAKKTFSKDF